MNTHFWWTKKDNAYEDIFSLVNTIEQAQSGETEASIDNYRLYGNMDRVGMDFYNYSQSRSLNTSANRVRINIIKSMVDTLNNKIAKNKPRVKYLTSGANATLQKASKQLEKFTDGQFYQTDIYKVARLIFRDAEIDGNGFLKIYRVRNKIKIERTLPVEIRVDDNECLHGKPRNMYQKRWLPKDSLIQMYPDKEHEIYTASVKSEYAGAYRPSGSSKSPDTILVIEAWHLPSYLDDGTKVPGKHIICIDNCTLEENDYNNDYFPFAIMRYTVPSVGFRGTGLSQDLRGIQTEINTTLRTIQLANELNGIPRVLIDKAAKVVQQHINNRMGSMIEYTGTKPEFVNAQPIHPDMYAWVDKLIDKAYQISGISQLSAQSQKPAGLNAGVALREYNDIEAERFVTYGQSYEEFFLDAAKQMIQLAREIEADKSLSAKEKYSVQVKGRKYLEKIKWSDIDLDEDSYQMQMFPASQLSQTPQGRKQDIMDYVNMGAIAKEDIFDLLNIPDLEGYMSSETASVRDIKHVIEKMIEDGEYQTPEPFQNLKYGIKAVMSAYLNYKWDCPPSEEKESRLAMMAQWIEAANDRIREAAIAEAQAQMAMQQPQVPVEQGTVQPAPGVIGGSGEPAQ